MLDTGWLLLYAIQTLAKAQVTYNQTLGLTPTIVAGWSVLFERLEETGELYPKGNTYAMHW